MSVDKKWFERKLEAKGLSQRRLAKLMKRDPSAINLMINGEQDIKLRDAVAFSDLLGVTLEEIAAAAGLRKTA